MSDPSGGNVANITGLDDTSGYRPNMERPAGNQGDGTSPNNAVIWQVQCGNFSTSKSISFTDDTQQTYSGFVPKAERRIPLAGRRK